MTIITGVVTNSNSRKTAATQHSPNGGEVWNLEIAGVWYGGMWDNPNAPAGSSVEFMAEQNAKGYWNVTKGSFKVVEQAAPPPAGATPSATPAPTVAPVDRRDISIRMQSCRKDAINMMDTLLAHEAVTLGTKAKKYDTYLALMDELTARNWVTLADVMDNGGLDVEDFIPPPGA